MLTETDTIIEGSRELYEWMVAKRCGLEEAVSSEINEVVLIEFMLNSITISIIQLFFTFF